MFSSIHDFTFLMIDTKGQVSLMTSLLRTSLFRVFRKKETFAWVIFGKVCYVACANNCAGKLICLRACLHKRSRAGLIDKTGNRIT